MSGNSNAFAGPWSSLPTTLTPWIMDVINSLGHQQMTPVQASTIPLFMRHKDVVVEAVTGSGKTLSFVIPILEKLIRREKRLKTNEIGVLIVSPTRELAEQIRAVVEVFLAAQPGLITTNEEDDTMKSEPAVPVYPPSLLLISSSSSSTSDDIQRFMDTGADIVVGTPGRVEEFILGKGRTIVNVKELEILVLDEADRLLDLGFTQSLTRIITALPKQRRTGLFSATMTDGLSELVRVGLRNPVRIVVKVQVKNTKDGKTTLKQAEERRLPTTLQNFYVECRSSEKILQMLRIIRLEMKKHMSSRFIIYFATCACVDYLYRVLPSLLPTASFHSLHGHLPPAKRSLTLQSFVSNVALPQQPCILLCTDVAARGLDIPDVDCVIQFDPPVDPKQFSHRCGRTARAGKEGRAWVLLTEKELGYIDFMSVRKIPTKERPYLTDALEPSTKTGDERPEDPAVNEFQSKIRRNILKDRDLHDKGTKSFVSFVRAYSRHEASYIFQLKNLDLVGVARSLGLLRLPRMPELKMVDRTAWVDAELEWSTFAYADKKREAQRVATLQAAEEAADHTTKNDHKKKGKNNKNESWSDQKARREEREKRKDKKDKKRAWQKANQSMTKVDIDSANTKRKQTDNDSDGEDDWDELAREERMAKKVKKGEVDGKAFDQEFTGF